MPEQGSVTGDPPARCYSRLRRHLFKRTFIQNKIFCSPRYETPWGHLVSPAEQKQGVFLRHVGGI